MTLVEVLLVLALLVVLAALALPALERPLAGQRLRRAADLVQTEWSHARVEAMSTGRTYVFRFTPASDRYSVQPRPGVETVVETVDGEVAEEAPAPLDPREETLPEGITFLRGVTDEDLRAVEALSLAAEAEEAPSGDSPPVLFYPDGTSSTARLLLKNEHGRRIEVSLRGLTGVVRVGEPYSPEEVQP